MQGWATETKVQRWLDLIAYLVSRRVPAAVEEVMERLPAYALAHAEGSRYLQAYCELSEREERMQ